MGSITGQTLSPKAKIALGKAENGHVSAKIEKLSFEKEGLVAELSGTADLEVCED